MAHGSSTTLTDVGTAPLRPRADRDLLDYLVVLSAVLCILVTMVYPIFSNGRMSFQNVTIATSLSG